MHIDLSHFFKAPIPDHARAFFDPVKTREWIKEYTVDGFNTWLNKIETPDFKLKVKDIHFENPDKKFSFKQQKEAILEKKDLTLPVKGTFDLIDKRSNKLVESKTMTVAHVPWVTDRNTVIYNGSEYIVTGQQRLKPGVYTRIKDTGEIEGHLNVKSGTGASGKLNFSPETTIFTYQVGTTKIKLYGLLRELGVSDAEMEQAWGKEIFLKNKEAFDGNELDKMYQKMFNY